MLGSRGGAGPWWGASHAGHGVLPSSASGLRSSSARAPSAATAGAGPTAPGVRRHASGSGSGARCSERIRGGCVQCTAVRRLELVHVGNGVVVGHARPPRVPRGAPFGRVGGRGGQGPPTPPVEPRQAPHGGVAG